ncbi:hypothetical protein AJ79_09541 [Helicocarpus griseus UAMH5409]|uniref:Potassium transport protein n=1 Tax=Helicocarpus griseus UAMH5409 TaxID=1447875 RepID=A0A2B7WJ69_9EURO|nr:hypothetical protein AJ79_09541 [Helicocarpus griseus UAMH5409]
MSREAIIERTKRAYWSSLEGLTTALQVLNTVKARIPVINSIRLNFLTLHYAYIIGCAIACSVVIYPSGNMPYIDALLFGSGAATQSGLNPIDVNLLFTYQQVGLWFVSMITNPIVIHSFVVFVRLFWFERRFQHVVRDAKTLRRYKSKSRTMTREREPGEPDGRDYDREEAGVRGKKIVLVRDNNTGQAEGHPATTDVVKKPDPESASESDTSTGVSPGSQPTPHSGVRSRENDLDDIIDHIRPMHDNDEDGNLRVPQHFSPEHHIAFLENQRRERGALRIPSPREYDRGGCPQAVEEDTDGEELRRVQTSQSEQPSNSAQFPQFQQPTSGPHITIDEPNIARLRSRTTTFPRVSSRHRPSTAAPGSDENSPTQGRARRGTLTSIFRTATGQGEDVDPSPYLSWQPTIGRNSAFVDLTEAQRDELGGIEYRALKALAVVLIGYFFLFHLLGIICLMPWIMETERFSDIVRAAGQGRPWWAIFTAGSAFNDQGFTITANSMMSLYDAIFPLLLLTFLIIIGNTGFPCMLRFVIWVFSHLVPHGGPVWEELRFLLDHPRRCFTLLFPRAATWWLFGVVVILNAVDVIFFIVLDLNDPDVNKIPPGIRFVDGLFQAAATRTAGMSVVNVSDLHPAVQVSYMIMMYISVFPIAISVRRTNVYEEGSLGIYTSNDDEEDEAEETFGAKKYNYVGAHLRRQLSFDLWYVFLGLFIIAIVEASRLDTNSERAFTMFAVMFEIVSAYGTVGLSLGFSGTNTSLCAQFKPLSKLIIIAMEIRGRHRGLPYQLDRAILLPSESLHRKELMDANKRSRRRSSFLSASSAVGGQAPSGPFRQDTGLSSGYQGQGPPGGWHWSDVTSLPPVSATNTNPRLPTHHEIV